MDEKEKDRELAEKVEKCQRIFSFGALGTTVGIVLAFCLNNYSDVLSIIALMFGLICFGICLVQSGTITGEKARRRREKDGDNGWYL
ncbi:MAG: hypothetical protein G01um101419_329 [Parcubacteria group bacterium Gr01-1014_19]|nr:MAG: hypothetical protein G01um101419_329 [Parcubacteria group bacterium Gr01-1014_19]